MPVTFASPDQAILFGGVGTMFWEEISSWFVGLSYSSMQLAAVVLMQSTVLIGLGLAAGRLLRGKGAALQSAVYRTTLAAVVLCPAASLLLDRAGVEGFAVVLPKIVSPPEQPVDVTAPVQTEVTPSQPFRSGDYDTLTQPDDPFWYADAEAATPSDDRVAAEDSVADNSATDVGPILPTVSEGDDVPVVVGGAETTSAITTAPKPDPTRLAVCLLTAVWFLGSSLLLIRLLAAHLGITRLRRSACEAGSASMAECRVVAERLGIRPPAVRRSPFVTSPCLVGLRRPTVLLPEGDAPQGESERDVLVHELAHLVRRDHVWNLFGRLSVAMLFFQPAMWLLLRGIVRAAEDVCDDYVVDFGLNRRDYARRLAEIAARFQPQGSAAAVGMISLKSLLSRRIVRILDGSRRLSLRAGCRAVAATLLIGGLGTTLVSLVAVGQNPTDAATDGEEPATAEKTPATDLFGDPLPPGAIARIGTVRLRHAEIVYHVAFTRDGEFLASAGRGGIRLWETDGGKPVHWWPNRSYHYHLAFSPNGKELASAGDSGIGILDVSTGEEILRFEAEQIRGLAYAPDGSSLLGWGGTFSTRGKVVSSSGVVRLFDRETGSVLREFLGHGGIVFSASLSPDGKILATSSQDNTVRFWETQTGRQVRQTSISDDVALDQGKWLPSDDRPRLAFSPKQNLLAVAMPDHTIRLWEVPSGKELRRLSGHEDNVHSLAFSPDGRLLVSGGRDEKARVWEVETGRQVRQLAGHQSWIECVAFSSDNRTVASGSQDHTVRLWDCSNGKEILPATAPEHWILGATLSPDGKWVATGGPAGLCVWAAGTGRLLYKNRAIGWVRCVAFSPDGKCLASGSWEHGLYLWKVSEEDEKVALAEMEHVEGAVSAVAFAPDAKIPAPGSSENRPIRFRDVSTGERRHLLATGSKGVNGQAFSPDGRLLASLNDGLVRFWDVESGQLVQQLGSTFDRMEADAIAFSADGRLLITSEGDRLVTIRVWHVATATEIAQFKRDSLPRCDDDGRVHHTWRNVHAVAVSPDGRILAVAEAGNRALLYDVQTGDVLAALEGHRNFVTALAFSGDGSRLVSASEDGMTALVWDLGSVLKPTNRTATRVEGGQIRVAGHVMKEPRPAPLRAADLAPPVRITAGGQPIDVGGHSAPFLGDFDGDGCVGQARFYATLSGRFAGDSVHPNGVHKSVESRGLHRSPQIAVDANSRRVHHPLRQRWGR